MLPKNEFIFKWKGVFHFYGKVVSTVLEYTKTMETTFPQKWKTPFHLKMNSFLRIANMAKKVNMYIAPQPNIL